ncbi:MAG: nitrous oxidase accessory protein [Xanthobacteraceae bacterium]|nr:nitrous oxidase accessory protein [Xanthobacteraceae bacterium]
MIVDRRHLLAATAASAATLAIGTGAARAAPGIDAGQAGLRPNSNEPQTQALQRAIDRAAASGAPLLLPPGTYRTGNLTLPAKAKMVGVRGVTRLVFVGGATLTGARGADHVELRGLTFDGGGTRPPDGRGLVQLNQGRGVRVIDCEFVGAGGHALMLNDVAGDVTGNTITAPGHAAIFSNDAAGLTITGNSIRDAGNNGIQVWRSQASDDGTIVADNRIENTNAKAGGSGQNGNAINVFRADNVIVRNNRISQSAFSAVRGNTASNLQISGNICTGSLEVALYAEFGFQGAVIVNNTVDGAAVGISVTNFNEGGRLAVVQGNLVRNLTLGPAPGTQNNDANGTGISVEADTLVTGNVVENAPLYGISAGWGAHLRDVSITDNIVRQSGIGIAVSVTPGAGAALIVDNLIAESRRGAVVGMEHHKVITGDLSREGAERYANLTVRGNRVR